MRVSGKFKGFKGGDVSNITTEVNWMRVKEEFATYGVGEREVDFLKVLCRRESFNGVEREAQSLAYDVIRMSKALSDTNDKEDFTSISLRPATTDEQRSFIVADLSTVSGMLRDQELGKAVKVLSEGLCDPKHALHRMAQNVAAKVEPLVVEIEITIHW